MRTIVQTKISDSGFFDFLPWQKAEPYAMINMTRMMQDLDNNPDTC